MGLDETRIDAALDIRQRCITSRRVGPRRVVGASNLTIGGIAAATGPGCPRYRAGATRRITGDIVEGSRTVDLAHHGRTGRTGCDGRPSAVEHGIGSTLDRGSATGPIRPIEGVGTGMNLDEPSRDSTVGRKAWGTCRYGCPDAREKDVLLLRVSPQSPQLAGTIPGQLDLNELEMHLSENTALVSVMLANNEIGVLQPIAQIAELCARYAVPLHCDAAQAVGRIPVDVNQLNVDLMSFSAHKFYGPKGVGGLYVRRRPRSTRLLAQIVGGGQQQNLRSGTLNAPGIIGMSAALKVCLERMEIDQAHTRNLRDRLWEGLKQAIPGTLLNGPSLSDPQLRLAANLNCSFPGIEGQSLMLAIPELCVSSGSACTTADPHPSHVLLALGLEENRVRSSLRFGIGRFNQPAEIDLAIQLIAQGYRKLAAMG